jgi:S1-C subfamily serine protease
MGTSSQGAAGTFAALSHELATAVEGAGLSVVAIDARPRVPTSGILWRPGLVVATNHTIRREEEITVTVADGRTLPAKMAGRDPSTDLALLKLGENGGEPAVTSGGADLNVGNLVLAVGRTNGNHLVTSLGLASSVSGEWRTWRGGRIDRFIRLDLSIFLGFSGSALVNASGGIAGINTTGLARGHGITIPASTVNRVVDELAAKGHIARGYIGIATQPVILPERLSTKLHLASQTALIIVTVEPDGPAEKAGMMIGDILVSLDGAPARDIGDIQMKLGSEFIGRNIAASVLRGGALVPLTLGISERPSRIK